MKVIEKIKSRGVARIFGAGGIEGCLGDSSDFFIEFKPTEKSLCEGKIYSDESLDYIIKWYLRQLSIPLETPGGVCKGCPLHSAKNMLYFTILLRKRFLQTCRSATTL